VKFYVKLANSVPFEYIKGDSYFITGIGCFKFLIQLIYWLFVHLSMLPKMIVPLPKEKEKKNKEKKICSETKVMVTIYCVVSRITPLY
jgi:hypothetical protein